MTFDTLALVRCDAACPALAATQAVDDVLETSAQADAIRAHAKQARDRQMETDPGVIRVRAERRPLKDTASARQRCFDWK